MGMKTVGKRERGQNLVEFALILPLFLLLVVGMAEFGRAWMTRNILTGAAREAVRAAAVETQANAYNSAKAIADPILASAGIPPLVPGDFDDSVDTPVPTVSVSITYSYPLIIARFNPALPGPNIPLNGTASMRRERY
ncbi:MAG: pilus assembly protein [Deltaproteobacteria bacterium]|nr:pilus assembly protein [Deltaproteobacteria bacterium]